MLYIATAELRAFKAQRFAANERDGLGLDLDLAYMPSGLFAIHKSFGCCMSENSVSDLVECRLMSQGRKRIYGDFAPIRKALNVAVHLIKRRVAYVQGTKRRIDVKTGNGWNVSLFTLGLRKYKPIRPEAERVAHLRFCCFVLSIIGLRGSVERHGHAKRDSFLALADLPFLFEPTTIGIQWAGLQVALNALFKRGPHKSFWLLYLVVVAFDGSRRADELFGEALLFFAAVFVSFFLVNSARTVAPTL